MSIPGAANPLLLTTAAVGGYQISRSLRFNSSDSAYLTRTYSAAPTTRTKGTISWLVKRATLGSDQWIFDCYDGSSPASSNLKFRSDNAFEFQYGGGSAYQLITTQVFRDVSAWYHFVFTLDSTLATAADRVKMYVNGSRVTTFSTANYPAQNANHLFTINTALNRIGCRQDAGAGTFLSAYLTDFFWIDGQALDPTSFGEFDDNGIWQPIEYSGTYGTNGFHLPFSDNSTAAALGTDTSGNGNTWTVNNLSVTAGAGNDSLVDVPTNGSQTDTGVGGEVRGNYCTWNPLDKSGSPTYSNGNLDAFTGASGYGTTRGTIAVSSGKWYWECTFNSTDASNDCYFGILDITGSLADNLGGNAKGYAYWAFNGNKVNNGSSSAYGSSYAPGDVIGVALNLDAGSITFYKNGVSQGTAFSSLSGTFAPAFSDSGGSSIGLTGNFGQRPFAYTAPSGFKALCTANLPAPVVTKPNTVMDVKLYTGNGSTQTISGLGFSPDLVWIKCRSAANTHALVDSIRGVTKYLVSASTDAEVTDSGGVTSLNSDGFSLTFPTSSAPTINANSATYVAWTWDAGSSTVTNTQGSISGGAQVRANTSAGFSVVTYTGDLTGNGTKTIGHGLGVAPELIIIKRRDGASDWHVKHKSLTSWQYAMYLNSTAAQSIVNTTYGTMSAPTSTVFSTSYTTDQNINGYTYVAYCFAPVSGYSSFGSYTGNGSTDGPFVYTGFRPRWILVKSSSTGGSSYDWFVYDTERDAFNAASKFLSSNYSGAEQATADAGTLTDVYFDVLSNGFKLRTSRGRVNLNAATFVYAAFAESPFAYSRAR